MSHGRQGVCQVLEGHVGQQCTVRDAIPSNVRGAICDHQLRGARTRRAAAASRELNIGRSVSKQCRAYSGFFPSGVLAFG